MYFLEMDGVLQAHPQFLYRGKTLELELLLLQYVLAFREQNF